MTDLGIFTVVIVRRPAMMAVFAVRTTIDATHSMAYPPAGVLYVSSSTSLCYTASREEGCTDDKATGNVNASPPRNFRNLATAGRV